MKYPMKRVWTILGLGVALWVCVAGTATAEKPNADSVLQSLKNGNVNFAGGKLTHPNSSPDRIQLASRTNQGDFAVATIVSCSDSRVPVEYIFDQGVMDLFIVRVAGNVCNTDEIGSAEYGVCHVNTPVLIVLGHSQCGAVTAVANAILGKGHALEKNIPPLVATIRPAVEKVMSAFPQATTENLINRSIEENVWRGIEQIFLKSAAIREKAKTGKLTVVGAIYELESGTVKWLPKEKVAAILEQAEASPDRSVEAMASSEGHGAAAKTEGEHTAANKESAGAPPKEESSSTPPSRHE
jgi:carbonic anhydrase